jgi:hypothetical protein
MNKNFERFNLDHSYVVYFVGSHIVSDCKSLYRYVTRILIGLPLFIKIKVPMIHKYTEP